MTDKALKAIDEAIEKLHWFKDSPEKKTILAALEYVRSQIPQEGEDMPDVIKYLLGCGSLDGCRFPDFPDNGEKYKKRYWWRTALRQAWSARASLDEFIKKVEANDA